MKIRMRSAVAIAAAAGLLFAGVTPAHAAKTITVWADEQRGPQLKSLIDGNTTIAPGYTIKVKFFSALTALQTFKTSHEFKFLSVRLCELLSAFNIQQ